MTNRVVIIGGSISGLMTGLALARRGIEVEIIERDTEADDVAGELSTASRRGTPQARHSQACMALTRRVLLDHAPDVWMALLAAGAREIPIAGTVQEDGTIEATFDDDELVGLACRRPVLEAVLRKCALAEPLVRLRTGVAVDGFISHPGAVPVVSGVTTSSGRVYGDLVIDASGRASALKAWLSDAGARPFTEIAHPCGVVLFSRFYRVNRWPVIRLNRGVAVGGMAGASLGIAFPGDNDKMSITVGVPAGDTELRKVGRDPAFSRAARLHPGVAPWLEPGVAEPESDVAPMAHLENRLRRFVVDGEPIALGLIPVGDAVCITDPSFGRGVSLAIAHTFALADAVVACGSDLRSLAKRADHITSMLLEPWFEDAVAQDASRAMMWSGAVPPPRPADAPPTLTDAMAVAPHDSRIDHAVLRRFNMVDQPGALLADEAILAVVRRLRTMRPQAPAGPSRDDLVAAIRHRELIGSIGP